MNIALINHLHTKTEIVDGHWLYTGHKTPAGQGIIWYNGSDCTVSRLALCVYLKLNYKDWSWLALHIDSICRHRHCWNPLHMYQGTQKDNMDDRAKIHEFKTHCVRGHAFTLENTLISSGRRNCRACNRIRNKKLYSTTQ